jgi:hypothetical protein
LPVEDPLGDARLSDATTPLSSSLMVPREFDSSAHSASPPFVWDAEPMEVKSDQHMMVLDLKGWNSFRSKPRSDENSRNGDEKMRRQMTAAEVSSSMSRSKELRSIVPNVNNSCGHSFNWSGGKLYAVAGPEK